MEGTMGLVHFPSAIFCSEKCFTIQYPSRLWSGLPGGWLLTLVVLKHLYIPFVFCQTDKEIVHGFLHSVPLGVIITGKHWFASVVRGNLVAEMKQKSKLGKICASSENHCQILEARAVLSPVTVFSVCWTSTPLKTAVCEDWLPFCIRLWAD